MSGEDLVCDHFIQPDTKLIRKTNRYFNWVALDCAREKPIPTAFNFYMKEEGDIPLFEKVMAQAAHGASLVAKPDKVLPKKAVITPKDHVVLGKVSRGNCDRII